MKKQKLKLLGATLFLGATVMMNSAVINIASANYVMGNQSVGVFTENNTAGKIAKETKKEISKENNENVNNTDEVLKDEETKVNEEAKVNEENTVAKEDVAKEEPEVVKEETKEDTTDKVLKEDGKEKIAAKKDEKKEVKKSFKERVQDILDGKAGLKDPNKNQIRAQKNKLTSKIEDKKGELLQTAIGDVDGDGKKEHVTLYGVKFTKGASYYKELYVVVRDEKNDKVENAFELEFGGYVPRLMLSNIMSKTSSEIVVSAPTGGSGGMINYSIWSLKNNLLNEIFTREDNDGIELEGEFLPNYKVKLYFPLAEKAIITDLPRGAEAYIQVGLYDTKGNLLKHHIKPNMQGMINLLPIDTNGDGVSELLFTQRIVGLYNADTLGYVVGYL